MASRLPKHRIQVVNIGAITSGNTFSKNNVALDLNYKKVIGIALNVSNETGLTNSTFTKFTIDGVEVFASGFEAKMIYTTMDQGPDLRFFTKGIDFTALGKLLNLTYVDGGGGVNYNANLYLLLGSPIDEETNEAGRIDGAE